MTNRRKLILLSLIMLAFPVALVLAHPMGNFSISHYTALRVESNGPKSRRSARWRRSMPTATKRFQQRSATPTCGKKWLS